MASGYHGDIPADIHNGTDPLCKNIPAILSELRGYLLLVVTDANVMAGSGEGRPGDVEPAGASEELVGIFTIAEERDQALELGWVLGADVGGLTEQVLGVLDASNEGVDTAVAKAGVDDDGTDFLTGRLQQHQAAIGQISDDLQRGLVVGVLLNIEKFAQRKVITESCVFH